MPKKIAPKAAKKETRVTAKRRPGMIEVGFARQVDPVKPYEVDANTPLAVFLALIDKPFDASIRVNGKVEKPDYILAHKDIINSVEAVAGGRA